MSKIFEAAKINPLFMGIDYQDFAKMLTCMDARTQSYEKEDIVLLTGDAVHFVGLILSGGMRIVKEDINGHATLLAELAAGDLFGEVFACAEIAHSPVTVQASEKSEVLFINYKKIITTCSAACTFHTKLIENMLRLIAKKNLMLNQKIELLSQRTTRDKLLMLFDMQRGDSATFTMPFNREEMARYLCVDRSAMSSELCKMRDEGLIRFHKHAFELLYL